MPIYSYRCKDCGKEFDLLVGVGKGDEKLKCGECGSRSLDRIPSSFAVRMGNSSVGGSGYPTGTCSLPSNMED